VPITNGARAISVDNDLQPDQGGYFLNRPHLLILLVIAGLVALPLAVWQDLRAVSDHNLRRQAINVSEVMGNIRSYYAKNVVARVNAADGGSKALHNYLEVDGAVPIPATLSIELGQAIGQGELDIGYRFVSDYPFENRPSHTLSPDEIDALGRFRAETGEAHIFYETNINFWNHGITMATPVVLGEACVGCHNSHPESPKTDWVAGDVRGVETITVHQPIALNIWSFKWLLGYLLVSGVFGIVYSTIQFRVAASFRRLNDDLAANNAFLAGISMKISKYLSPQVYRSIFSGEKEVEISTERKKLTVFFSDIKDFTSTTEQLQPEELTQLLNEYFTEMCNIAESHGATIDKFIGDAIVAFFGDPETKGTAEDARACVRMALDMQQRLAELDGVWRARGLEHPFRARMGINTGYCNVGNFGSQDRMDYTIIGAEANLAARLEGIAQPGGIVMSYETYAHVRDIVNVSKLEPVNFKGIAREVVPYEIAGIDNASVAPVVEETSDGARLTVNLDSLDEATRDTVRKALQSALARPDTAGS